MSPQSKQILAVCHFDSRERAEQAVRELQQIGVDASSVKTFVGDSLTGSSPAQVREQFLAAGVHEDYASHLENELREKGGVLALVRAELSNEDRVDEILRRYGAYETDEFAPGQDNSARPETADNQTLKVVEEELVVGKRAVTRGGMRIYSRVVEHPVEENIHLTEETVRVERHKVDRPISQADLDALQRDQVVEVTAKGEEAVVSKKARVVEEVSIGKDVTERTDTIRDTVRKTDVRIEKIDQDVDTYFQNDFKTRYGKTGQDYKSYAPAYEYGYTMASDPKYKGKSYRDVEQTLRTNYESKYPGTTWDKMKAAVQTGWDKVTGR